MALSNRTVTLIKEHENSGATSARSRAAKGPALSQMGCVPKGKGSAPGEGIAVPSRQGAVPPRKGSVRRETGAVPKTKASAPREPPAVAAACCAGAESGVGAKAGGVGARPLREVLKTLSLGRQDTSEASEHVNQLIRALLSAIRAREGSFSSVEILGTGSYYEHVKISAPNEFDIMFTMPAPRVELEQCDGSGAFYYVRLKRNPQGNDLDKFIQEDGTLAACKMLFALRNIIKEIVKSMTRTKMKVTVDKKKAGSPAITLRIGNPPMEISVDIILALEVRSQSWPASTQDGLKIEKWLGRKVKQEYKWKPIYLVPKHAKDGRVLKEPPHCGLCKRDAGRHAGGNLNYRHCPPQIPLAGGEGERYHHWLLGTVSPGGIIISCRAESAMEIALLPPTHNEYKSKHQAQLADAHLAAILNVSTAQSLRPNINKLTELKHCQVAGEH
ncbi:Protein MB21D1 [Chelonia mydas]|uniref:Protein MB21D1 n=1 Tax=Chelonia mydas TaxID=8469 RepID=M7BF26_CHEMY|nr:Protein MB21D1 [Chelonia mydas]